MSSLRFPHGLYGITPNWADTDRLLNAITQAHAGGMTALQWRRKNGQQAELIEQASAIRALCKRLALPFIVNDNWQMAAQLDADGVHLGKDDGPIEQARQNLGPNKIIGCSCYNQLTLAQQAITAGADYIAFGAVYPSSTKPQAPKAGLDLIRRAKAIAGTHTAIVTIGGINTENAASLVQAGTDSIAVISSLFEAKDITQTARVFAGLF